MKKPSLPKTPPKVPPVCQHIGLFVHDIEKITRFYKKKLGFSFVKEYVIDQKMMKKIFGIDSRSHMRYLDRDGLGMELFQLLDKKMKKRPKGTAGYDHWNIVVADKVKFCERLKKQGTRVIKIPKPHGTTYFIKDPEGNLIEVKSYQL